MRQTTSPRTGPTFVTDEQPDKASGSPARRRIADSVFFLAGAAACLLLAGMHAVTFTEPISIRGDHINLLVTVKDVLQGGGGRFVQALGFPGVRDNLYFPLFDASYIGLLWLLSFFTRNVFRLVSLFYVVGIVLMFAFSYLALRRLAISACVASAVAVAYVVSPYFGARAAAHDFLALYYGVPLGAVLPLLMTTCHTAADFRRLFGGWFGLLAIAVLATSGVYYAFFATLLIGVTGLALTIGRRSLAPLAAAAAFCAVVVILLVFAGYGFDIVDVFRGAVPKLDRETRHQLFFSLILADALHVYRDIGIGVERFVPYENFKFGVYSDGLRYEWPGVVFTTIILAAPIVLLARAAVPAGEPSNRAVMAWLAAGLITFLLLFAMRGGLGYIFNHIFGPWIRSQTRVTPFMSFYAAVLVCFAVEALWSKRRAWSRVAALALTVATVASIVPYAWPLARKQAASMSTPLRQQSLPDLKAMLAAKDAAGLTAVLQLPLLGWPEVAPQRDFAAYNHQLGYIYDRRDSRTRWSYGQVDAQPGSQAVRTAVTPDRDLPGLADRARALKFDSILIEKAAYTPEELAALTGALSQRLGPACLIHDGPMRMLFALERGRNRENCRPPD